jgi:hypothetical protein
VAGSAAARTRSGLEQDDPISDDVDHPIVPDRVHRATHVETGGGDEASQVAVAEGKVDHGSTGMWAAKVGCQDMQLARESIAQRQSHQCALLEERLGESLPPQHRHL